MTRLTLTAPDDWHLHLRDGAALAATVPASARWARRAIVMPNLEAPVTTTAAAIAYRERILEARPAGSSFEPLMTLYLTDRTTAEEIDRARSSGVVHGVKLYPAGATTNSDSGVTDLDRMRQVLERMAEVGLPLLIHGEVTRPGVDIFDRERVFVKETLPVLMARHPSLRIVLEHITTVEAAEQVEHGPERLAATITPQHLLANRNHMLVGGIRPHYYCLPILKRESDRLALLRMATSGHPRFFLGTDSAPHAASTKETSCGCAGCFTALTALELYAEAFQQADALDRLEGFASFHGPDFYGLPRNEDTVTLALTEQSIPTSYPFADAAVVPFRAGETLRFQLET